MEITLIIFALALILVPIFLYNSLIGKKNTVKESYSGIEVQLKRRYDLIPNLVNTVKGYAKHEADTFEKVTKARTEAMHSKNIHDKAKAENEISDTLKSLFAVAESYPALKADQNFLHLQQELSDTEDKLSASRRFYNGAVNSFNTAIESVPTNIIAGIFKFKKADFFEIEAEEKEQAKNPTQIKF